MKKLISILGSTGSVGLNTLKIIDQKKNKFEFKVDTDFFRTDNIYGYTSNNIWPFKKLRYTVFHFWSSF